MDTAVEAMQDYSFLREDLDSLIEVAQWPGSFDPLKVPGNIRAGHFGIFGIFSIKKNDFIFYQVNNLFLHQSYLKSPLPVKLT